MVAAIMHQCADDTLEAKRLFQQVLSHDHDNSLARFMLLLNEWFDGCESSQNHVSAVSMLDWQSPDEFIGFLGRILLGEVDAFHAINGGYSPSEKSLLYLVAGLAEERDCRAGEARSLFEKGAVAVEVDDWSLFLALSRLDRMRRDLKA